MSGILVAACLLATCGAPAVQEGEEPRDLPAPDTSSARQAEGAVVFYNTENLFDAEDDPRVNDNDFLPDGRYHWTEERYRNKLNKLAEAIALADNDAPLMIGLAEVENRAVTEALARTGSLARTTWTVVHEDSPDPRGIDVALLVNRAFGEVVARRFLPVDLESGVTRDILYAIVRTRAGQTQHVFVNHWPSRRAGEEGTVTKRRTAARVLRGAVDRLLAENPRASIIILGDLNDGPEDGSVRSELGASPDDLNSVLVNLTAFDDEEPAGSISHNGSWAYFDQVIVSRALVDATTPGVKARSAASIKDRRLIFHHPRYGDQPDRTFSGNGDYHASGYSDHLPVVLRLAGSDR